MKKDNSDSMTTKQKAELKALSALPEEKIDTSDAPEQRNWADGRRGVFFRPIKHQITLRLDADVIEWFKRNPAKGTGYQTRINQVLRNFVEQNPQD